MRIECIAAITSWIALAMLPVDGRAQARLWAGSTDGKIRVLALGEDGKLELQHTCEGPKGLGFVAFHPSKRLAYACVRKSLQVFEIDERGVPKPSVAIDAGVRGTHLDVDPKGRFVFWASYGGGTLKAFPLDARGRPGEATFVRKTPEALTKKAHQVRAHPGGRFVYAPCLGNDVVQILEIVGAVRDGDRRPASVRWVGRVRLEQGSGPRHLDFDPSGAHLYVLNELASTTYSYRIDQDSGALTEIQAMSALPMDESGGSRSSDIHVSRSGRFAYAVHREPLNQVVSFRVAKNGRLRTIGRTPTGGVHSRSFALSDDGRFAIFGHSKTRNVVVRRISKSGIVGAKSDELAVEAPVFFIGFPPAHGAGTRKR